MKYFYYGSKFKIKTKKNYFFWRGGGGGGGLVAGELE